MKTLENAILKINKKVKDLASKYNYIEYTKSETNIYEDKFTFSCYEHGEFTLKGIDIRNNHICPKCENNDTSFDSLTKDKQIKILSKKFPKYDFKHLDEKVINYTTTIRPICPEHGEFLTTPKKLLEEADSCKWCDGSQNESYKMTKEGRLLERVKLIYPNPDFVESVTITNGYHFNLKTTDNTFASYNILDTLKKTKDKYNEVKNTLVNDRIFFRADIRDKSSKFEFSIVGIIDLINHPYDAIKENIVNYLYGIHSSELNPKEETFEFVIKFSEVSNGISIGIMMGDYIKRNSSKLIVLPDQIIEKIKGYHDLKFNFLTFWSPNNWETTSNSVKLIRESISKVQNECPICSKPVTDPVVDHEHKKKIKGSGRVRDNICSTCNVFIAKTENNCRRYKIELEELPEVLKNVSAYFSKQQYNIIHYTDKEKKPTLKKSEAAKVVKYWEVLYPNKKQPKIPKSGTLTKDWEEYFEALDNYLENPYPTLNKGLYNKLVKLINEENLKIEEENLSLPKTRKKKFIKIPEYPKLKVETPEIQKLLEEFKLI